MNYGPLLIMTHWTTLITTADYAEGVVCLAVSLSLVRSRAQLLCYTPSVTVDEAIHAATRRVLSSSNRSSCHSFPNNLLIKRIPEICIDGIFSQDASRDTSLFIDAPRRFLFRLAEPFIFLDADMIATQNFDELLDYLDPVKYPHDGSGNLIAVPNFRNKKKIYGDAHGNFNAGMMIVPEPLIGDYDAMMRILVAGYNDTEEKLLNDVFRNRWQALPVSYNCQKRAFKFAPEVWNAVVDSRLGVKIIHYVGGKPWQSQEELRRLDWEATIAAASAAEKSTSTSTSTGVGTISSYNDNNNNDNKNDEDDVNGTTLMSSEAREGVELDAITLTMSPYKPLFDVWHQIMSSMTDGTFCAIDGDSSSSTSSSGGNDIHSSSTTHLHVIEVPRAPALRM